MRKPSNAPVRGAHCRRSSLTVVLMVGLSVVAACQSAGDDQQPVLPTVPSPPPAVTPPPLPVVPSLSLGSQMRELMVGASFLITGSVIADVLNHPATSDTTVAIEWRTDGNGAVSVQAIDKRRAWVSGEAAGEGWIQGSALGANSHVYLTVLDPADTSVVSPIVIDDFRVFEHRRRYGGELVYSPQITLHDGSASAGAALIAVSLDIPGLEPTAPCAMLRPIDAAPQMVFSYDSYFQDFEYNIPQTGRSPLATVAVAHLVIRLPNRTATKLTISGPIVTQSQLPRDDYWPASGDYLSCE